jgi:hypothetical protein
LTSFWQHKVFFLVRLLGPQARLRQKPGIIRPRRITRQTRPIFKLRSSNSNFVSSQNIQRGTKAQYLVTYSTD